MWRKEKIYVDIYILETKEDNDMFLYMFNVKFKHIMNKNKQIALILDMISIKNQQNKKHKKLACL